MEFTSHGYVVLSVSHPGHAFDTLHSNGKKQKVKVIYIDIDAATISRNIEADVPIGTKLGNHHRNVIAISGDGGMQMDIQEIFYDRHYSCTCKRYRRSCDIGCNHSKHDCPEYTPDFVRLAESYGAKGIRVTNLKILRQHLKENYAFHILKMYLTRLSVAN